MTLQHQVIFTTNSSNKKLLLDFIFNKTPSPYFTEIATKKGALFCKTEISRFIAYENRYEIKLFSPNQSLSAMSSGEQKKALLHHILKLSPDYIVLDNPFDNLDIATQSKLKETLKAISYQTQLIQLISRKEDRLSFIKTYRSFQNEKLTSLDNLSNTSPEKRFNKKVPPPLSQLKINTPILVHLKNVNISYQEQKVLKNINWKINKGDFWELKGPNGSGKTTILSMITGENPKGYGQELYLFGQKKGSGESVWDIKKNIGYFTPAMTDTFKGGHTIEHMIISGITDSVGLYTIPTETQLILAKAWLSLLEMLPLKDTLFRKLSEGNQRLVMCVRAMIKHPPLLILDEPTADLDDDSAALLVALVNTYSKQSDTAIVFVSHRSEPYLQARFTYQLQPTPQGATGKIDPN